MFHLVFEGLENVETTLGRLGVGLTDLEIPTQAALEALAHRVFDRVQDGLSPDIRPESRAQRRVDREAPPLIDSGEMMLAATATSDGYDHSQYRLEPDGLGGQIGVDGDFHGAMRHQFGFGVDRLGRTFQEPPRAFLTFGEGDEAVIVEVYDRYLVELMGARYAGTSE